MAQNITQTTSTNISDPIMVAMKEGMKYEGETFAANFYSKKPIKQAAFVGTTISTSELLREVTEDEVAPTLPIIQGFEQTIPWRTFGSARQITKVAELMKGGDQLYKLAKDFGASAIRTRDYIATQPLRQAFDSSVLYGDGQPLAYTAQPLKTGTTFANTFTDGIQRAFSESTLNDALSQMNRVTDHSGNVLTLSGKLTVIVSNYSTALINKIWSTIGDKTPLQSDQGNGKSNFYRLYKGAQVDLLILPSLSPLVAQQMGEISSITVADWENRWAVVDSELIKEILVMPVLEGYENLTQTIETESFSEKFIYHTSYGCGINASTKYGMFFSRGDNAALGY
jgi:hypothetical protein